MRNSYHRFGILIGIAALVPLAAQAAPCTQHDLLTQKIDTAYHTQFSAACDTTASQPAPLPAAATTGDQPNSNGNDQTPTPQAH
jgi:hypothetical protein